MKISYYLKMENYNPLFMIGQKKVCNLEYKLQDISDILWACESKVYSNSTEANEKKNY